MQENANEKQRRSDADQLAKQEAARKAQEVCLTERNYNFFDFYLLIYSFSFV